MAENDQEDWDSPDIDEAIRQIFHWHETEETPSHQLDVQVSDLMLYRLDQIAEQEELDRSSLVCTIMNSYFNQPDDSFDQANEALKRLHEQAAAPEPTWGPPAQWQARLTVMVDENLLRSIDERASRQGVTRSALIRRIFIERLPEEYPFWTQTPELKEL